MSQTKYSGAVAKLLEIGQPDDLIEPDKWPDYSNDYGLNQADIPELIRMTIDEDLNSSDSNAENPEDVIWAPIHALRALGQLKATQAIEPLLKMFDWDDDYSLETLPFVYGLIGPTAIPALRDLLQKYPKDVYSFESINIIQALTEIGKLHPEGKDEVIEILLQLLEEFAENEASINGFLISALTDLKAEKALPLIKEVFEEEEVDESIVRWHSVQRDFGLITQEEHDRIEAEYVAAHRANDDDTKLTLADFGISTNNSVSAAARKKKDKAKAKRKIAKASQKKNRKKK